MRGETTRTGRLCGQAARHRPEDDEEPGVGRAEDLLVVVVEPGRDPRRPVGRGDPGPPAALMISLSPPLPQEVGMTSRSLPKGRFHGRLWEAVTRCCHRKD
jgi:hypothetical protein